MSICHQGIPRDAEELGGHFDKLGIDLVNFAYLVRSGSDEQQPINRTSPFNNMEVLLAPGIDRGSNDVICRVIDRKIMEDRE